MVDEIVEPNTNVESLKQERSTLQVELTKAINELELRGKVVSHLEDAQGTRRRVLFSTCATNKFVTELR